MKPRKGITEMNDKITEILSYWGLRDSEIHQICDTVWQAGSGKILKHRDGSILTGKNMIK